MEIEAKFRIENPQVFTTLISITQLEDFHFMPQPSIERQHNTYYDTSDARLEAHQYGLRIRDLGHRRIATLKGPARGSGALHIRDEWESDIGDEDQPSQWPTSTVRERTLALIGDQPLVPLLTIHTERRHILASRANQLVAELSLDSGLIRAGGREQPFRELEIELMGQGTQADLDELVALLSAHFPLIPEEQSKLARGLKLLKEANQQH